LPRSDPPTIVGLVVIFAKTGLWQKKDKQIFYETQGVKSVNDKAARAKESHRRVVPGFSTQSRQKDVRVAKPKVTGIFEPRVIGTTIFKKFYERGDFPFGLELCARGNRIAWKVPLDKIDYHHYLPLFFEGLRETTHPYEFLARQGCHDLLENGGPLILPVVPQLIMPLKRALTTHNAQVMCTTLKALQHLILCCDLCGEALVPYYRQLLPTFNIFKFKNANLGDKIEYSQQLRENLGDLINETLELMERHGGEDAFINIKYMIPTYESCVLN